LVALSSVLNQFTIGIMTVWNVVSVYTDVATEASILLICILLNFIKTQDFQLFKHLLLLNLIR